MNRFLTPTFPHVWDILYAFHGLFDFIPRVSDNPGFSDSTTFQTLRLFRLSWCFELCDLFSTFWIESWLGRVSESSDFSDFATLRAFRLFRCFNWFSNFWNSPTVRIDPAVRRAYVSDMLCFSTVRTSWLFELSYLIRLSRFCHFPDRPYTNTCSHHDFLNFSGCSTFRTVRCFLVLLSALREMPGT